MNKERAHDAEMDEIFIQVAYQHYCTLRDQGAMNIIVVVDKIIRDGFDINLRPKGVLTILEGVVAEDVHNWQFEGMTTRQVYSRLGVKIQKRMKRWKTQNLPPTEGWTHMIEDLRQKYRELIETQEQPVLIGLSQHLRQVYPNVCKHLERHLNRYVIHFVEDMLRDDINCWHWDEKKEYRDISRLLGSSISPTVTTRVRPALEPQESVQMNQFCVKMFMKLVETDAHNIIGLIRAELAKHPVFRRAVGHRKDRDSRVIFGYLDEQIEEQVHQWYFGDAGLSTPAIRDILGVDLSTIDRYIDPTPSSEKLKEMGEFTRTRYTQMVSDKASNIIPVLTDKVREKFPGTLGPTQPRNTEILFWLVGDLIIHDVGKWLRQRMSMNRISRILGLSLYSVANLVSRDDVDPLNKSDRAFQRIVSYAKQWEMLCKEIAEHLLASTTWFWQMAHDVRSLVKIRDKLLPDYLRNQMTIQPEITQFADTQDMSKRGIKKVIDAKIYNAAIGGKDRVLYPMFAHKVEFWVLIGPSERIRTQRGIVLTIISSQDLERRLRQLQSSREGLAIEDLVTRIKTLRESFSRDDPYCGQLYFA